MWACLRLWGQAHPRAFWLLADLRPDEFLSVALPSPPVVLGGVRWPQPGMTWPELLKARRESAGMVTVDASWWRDDPPDPPPPTPAAVAKKDKGVTLWEGGVL